MSYDINFGTGELGDFSISEGAIQNINSYAEITEIDSNTVTIDNITEGQFETFRAGVEVMLHVSATNRETAEHLGKFLFAQIILTKGNVLTLDKNVEEFFQGVDLDFEYLQVITIPNFDCVRIARDAVITAPPYHAFKHTGGIVILRAFNNIELYGNIDLRECGIPYNRQNSLRPLHWQESEAQGALDKSKFSGQENFITAERFLLNAGDGACILIAKNLITDENARIGNPSTHGSACCRGAADSCGVKPSNITNIGGSTILIAADNISNFSPKIIAKYRSSELPKGKGLCRCYIATNSFLPHDEGLYSHDFLTDKARVQNLGIENFGNGSFGDATNPTNCFNNYAKILSVADGGHRLLIDNKSLSGLAPLKTGALVLVQSLQSGKFTVARILDIKNNAVILDKPFNFNEDAQIISIPEFSNLTINTNYSGTKKFNGTGGVLAVAVADTFNLENGKLNVEGKGGNNCEPQGNLPDRLILGTGAGSVFILAKKLVLNENSRIGSLHSGEGEGGRLGGSNPGGSNAGGGYSGVSADVTDPFGAGGGYKFGGGSKGAGSGFSQGGSSFNFDFSKVEHSPELNGANLFLVVGEMVGFSIANISTGGKGAKGAQNGACGYGGGGNATQAGGNAGSCFIYCQKKF